jgi:uncharacterized protein with von Willebrand factor type A (vWA) domain
VFETRIFDLNKFIGEPENPGDPVLKYKNNLNVEKPSINISKPVIAKQLININETDVNQELIVQEPVEETVEEQVEEPIEEPVEESVEKSVEEPVEETVEESVEEQVEEQVEETVEEQVEEQVEEPVEEQVEEPVEEQVEEEEELIEIIIREKTYYTTNEINGIIYKFDEKTESYIEKGNFVDGKAKFIKKI